VVGKNTVDCMKSGIIFGNASMIDGMIDRINAEVGEELPVIVTGGYASAVIPHCNHNMISDEYLVLKGLNLIYHKNK
jgi:type III pantothenate kinase